MKTAKVISISKDGNKCQAIVKNSETGSSVTVHLVRSGFNWRDRKGRVVFDESKELAKNGSEHYAF